MSQMICGRLGKSNRLHLPEEKKRQKQIKMLINVAKLIVVLTYTKSVFGSGLAAKENKLSNILLNDKGNEESHNV